MQIVNLVSWAGETFSHAPGDVLDLPDDLAQGRIDAGLATPVPPDESDPEPVQSDQPAAQSDPAPARRGPGRPRK